MAKHDHISNPSARLTPEIDRGRPTLPAGRRRILALAAGAGALAATSAHAASATIDEPLESLWHERERLDQLYAKACEAACDAEDAAARNHPPRPKLLYTRKHGTDTDLELDEATIRHWLDQSRRLGISCAAHERQLAAWHE